MARFHITIIRPRDYLHSDCFREVADGLRWALMERGHAVTFLENWVDPSATTILLGPHLLSEVQALSLPPTTVVYNLEPLGGYTTPEWYFRLAEVVSVWDYSPANLPRWQSVPCRRPVSLVEIGYSPELTRIRRAPVQNIDVLFYGAVTERRRHVLDALTAAGFTVHVAFGVYGAERDELIARAKLVLNLHSETLDIFEAVRVSYLLANRKAVVAEESRDFGALRDAVAVCTYDSAVEVCRGLLADDARRHQVEKRGFLIFSSRPQTQLLPDVLPGE